MIEKHGHFGFRTLEKKWPRESVSPTTFRTICHKRNLSCLLQLRYHTISADYSSKSRGPSSAVTSFSVFPCHRHLFEALRNMEKLFHRFSRRTDLSEKCVEKWRHAMKPARQDGCDKDRRRNKKRRTYVVCSIFSRLEEMLRTRRIGRIPGPWRFYRIEISPMMNQPTSRKC